MAPLRASAVLAAATAVGALSALSADVRARPWLNQALPVNERVALLLGNMTLDEKVAQLTYGTAGVLAL